MYPEMKARSSFTEWEKTPSRGERGGRAIMSGALGSTPRARAILEDTQHEDVLNEMRKILEGKDLEAFDELMAASFSTPEHPKTEADHREMTREQIRKSKPLPRIPYVVLMAAGRAKAMAPLFSDRAIEKIAKLDSELNDRLAALIPGGRQVIVEGTGHDIHVDKPEVLIALVMEMIDTISIQAA